MTISQTEAAAPDWVHLLVRPLLHSRRSAARWAGVSVQRIRAAINRGELATCAGPAYQPGQTIVRPDEYIHDDDLVAWTRSLRHAS